MTPKSERESPVSPDQIIVDHSSTMGFEKPPKGEYLARTLSGYRVEKADGMIFK